jgi:tight adherence protein B
MPVAIAVFVVVFALILGAYWFLVASREEKAGRAVRRRLRGTGVKPLVVTLLKARERLSSVAPLERMLTRLGSVIEPLRETIVRSGLRITLGTLVLGSLFLGFITALIVAQLTSAIAGLAAGVGISCLPTLYVRRTARKRIAKFEEQFPDVIDLMARALRAGHALPTALQLVADEAPQPVGSEFRLLFDQQNFGMSLTDALKAFAARVPLLDVGFFVTAVLTQREMGGNLSEVLDNLASVIRERFKVKRQVRVVSAHGRITGLVLGCLPPAIAGLLFLISPAHIRVLVEDPIGLYMVAGGIVLQTVGVLWIRWVVNVEY